MAEMAARPSAPGGKARLLHQVVQQILDPRRILALEEGHQVVEQRDQRPVGTVVVALAPAGEAVVGVDGDDDARTVLVARHEGAQAVNLHRLAFLTPRIRPLMPPTTSLILRCFGAAKPRGRTAVVRPSRLACGEHLRMREVKVAAALIPWAPAEIAATAHPWLHVDMLVVGPRRIAAGGFRDGDRDVRLARMGRDEILVDVAAEAGRVGHCEVTVLLLRMRHDRAGAAVPIVLDPLQDVAVRHRGEDMERRIFGHGAERARMRRQHHVMGFRDRRDLLHLRDAAGAAGVGLDHVDKALLDQLALAEDRRLPLAGGERDGGMLADAVEALEILGRDRILDPHQLVGLERPADLSGVGRRQPGRPCRSMAISIVSPTASRSVATMRTGSETPPHLKAV